MKLFFKRKKARKWEQEERRSRENLERFDKTKKRLRTEINHKDLARLYFELLDGTWDEAVFGNMDDYESIYIPNIQSAMMRFIKCHVGTKGIERYQYVDIQGHTPDEFEDYWQSLVADRAIII